MRAHPADHDGRLFLACTNTAPRDPVLGRPGGNVGNFTVRSDDPAEEWSDAAWVDSNPFDPSLTFADGTCHYTRRGFDLIPFTGLPEGESVAIT